VRRTRLDSVCERLANVFFLEIRICIENLCIRVPRRNKTNNRPDGNTQAAKAGFATHDFAIAVMRSKSDILSIFLIVQHRLISARQEFFR
jgi:hypothetical protein